MAHKWPHIHCPEFEPQETLKIKSFQHFLAVEKKNNFLQNEQIIHKPFSKLQAA